MGIYCGHTLCGHLLWSHSMWAFIVGTLYVGIILCGHKSVGTLYCAFKCRFLGTLFRNADRDGLDSFCVFIQLNWEFLGTWPGSHNERRVLGSTHSWQCLFASEEINNHLPTIAPQVSAHTLAPWHCNSVPKGLPLTGNRPNPHADNCTPTCIISLIPSTF